MVITLGTILMVVAFVCFLLQLFNVSSRINLSALAFACWTGAILFGGFIKL